MATKIYIISHCTVADGPALSANNIPAFWENPHWILTWRHRTLEQHIVEVTKRFTRNLLDNRETQRYQMAIDPETGRIVGYAKWYLPPTHATNTDGTPAWPEATIPMVGAKEEAEIRRVADSAIWDPNEEPDALLEPMRKIKNEILARKPYMRLDYLAVHPEQQGKGIATALVQSGMRQAENLGLDIFINAFKAGLGVYRRLGFRLEAEIIQDDSIYGGPGDFGYYFLIYEQNIRIDA